MATRGTWAVAMLALVGTLACSAPAEESAEPEAPASQPAPDFSLQPLGGGEAIDLAGLRGKTVILDFWATWCPPCEFQVPELNRFYEAHRSDGDVVVYGISVDIDGPDVVEAWVTEKEVRYPILLGGEDVARDFGAVGFPTLYVIAPDGTLREEHVGLIEADMLEASLRAHREAMAAAAPQGGESG